MRNKLSNLALVFLVVFVFLGAHITSRVSAQSSGEIESTVAISVCGNGIKEGGERCDTADLGGQSCSAIGYDAGILTCNIGCDFEVSACTTSAEEVAVATLISKESGGTNEISRGPYFLSLNIPRNYSNDDHRNQLFLHSSTTILSSKSAPPGKFFVGKVYDIILVDPDGEVTTSIDLSSTVTIKYTDSDISSLDEGTIKPYRYLDDSSTWQLISGSILDADANTVTFNTASFSFYTLLGESPASESDSEPESSSGGSSYIRRSPIQFFSGTAYTLPILTTLESTQYTKAVAIDQDGTSSIKVDRPTTDNHVSPTYDENSADNYTALFAFSLLFLLLVILMYTKKRS